MEHDVGSAVRAVFDRPVARHGAAERRGVERQGGQVAAPFQAGAAVSLDPGLDDGGGAQAWRSWLAGKAPGRGEPVHVVAGPVAADLDAAVIAAAGVGAAVDHGSWIVQAAPALVVQALLVVLECEQAVAATAEDGVGNFGLRCRGLNGDERPGEGQAFERQPMAVISLDLASRACGPSTRRWLPAHAEAWGGSLDPCCGGACAARSWRRWRRSRER